MAYGLLALAMQAKPDPVPQGMALGAARIYVTVYGPHLKAVKKEAKALGLHWTAHGIYIGYDNFTGSECMRGEAIAKALNVVGISAYQHTVED